MVENQRLQVGGRPRICVEIASHRFGLFALRLQDTKIQDPRSVSKTKGKIKARSTTSWCCMLVLISCFSHWFKFVRNRARSFVVLWLYCPNSLWGRGVWAASMHARSLAQATRADPLDRSLDDAGAIEWVECLDILVLYYCIPKGRLSAQSPSNSLLLLPAMYH